MTHEGLEERASSPHPGAPWRVAALLSSCCGEAGRPWAANRRVAVIALLLACKRQVLKHQCQTARWLAVVVHADEDGGRASPRSEASEARPHSLPDPLAAPLPARHCERPAGQLGSEHRQPTCYVSHMRARAWGHARTGGS